MHSTDIAKQLIDAGANVNAKDKNGCATVLYATFYQINDNVHVLMDAGTDVNCFFVRDREYYLSYPIAHDYLSKFSHLLYGENLITWKKVRLGPLFM